MRGAEDKHPAITVPWFTLSAKCPLRTNPAEISAYYDNHRLMVRNVIMSSIVTAGWAFALNIVNPLIQLRLKSLGVHEDVQGYIYGINLFVISILVLYFSWLSDHTVSRMGRRSPYLFIAAPAIILTKFIFPFVDIIWLLIILQAVHLLFMDLKESTFSLIMIDCMPRAKLARATGALSCFVGLVAFGTNWIAGPLIALGEWVPYIVSGTMMGISTLAALKIKEPPIYHPPVKPFRPWSTFVVAFRDWRIFVLMCGVGMLMSYNGTSTLFLWLWSSETLHLSRSDIFKAISWAALLNVVLSYPIGWLIDRVGGLKVATAYWVLICGCYFLMVNVHGKTGLAILAMAHTVVFPIYRAADIMVYKCCPADEVGSITATNSCLRDGFLGIVSIAAGYLVRKYGSNYLLGMGLGLSLATVGLVFMYLFAWLVRKRPLYLGEVGDAYAADNASAIAPCEESPVLADATRV